MAHSITARARAFIPFLAAATVLQLVFWLVLLPIFEAKVPLDQVMRFDSIDVATLDEPTYAAVQRARFTREKTPWSDCCTGGYRVARYHIPLTEVPQDGLLIGGPAIVDNMRIYANGHLVYGDGRMNADNPTFHGNISQPYFISPGLLRAGDNLIDVIMVRSIVPWFDAGSMIAAPHDRTQVAFASRSFRLNDLGLVNIGLAATLALLSFLLAMRSDMRALAIWTGLLLGSFALLNGFYRWVDPPMTPYIRLNYYFALWNLQSVAWLGLLVSWSRADRRWFAPLCALMYAGFTGMTALWLARTDGSGFDIASDWSNWFRLGLTLIGVIVFLWELIRRGTANRTWEAAVLLLCASLLASTAVSEMLWDVVFTPMEWAMGLFLLAFAMALIARNVRLFQSQQSLNAMLSDQLTQRTADLEAAHARETLVVRAQAHQAERQRIMRDMHDGLGSQLMSMLLMARRGEANPPVVAEGLQSVIDEMRLMIDSMDSVGESLSSALTIFRDRMQSRVEGAGKRFAWTEDFTGTMPDLGPRDILQVFRIMQEAVTNALKHAAGDMVSVTITAQPDAPHAIRIIVADNGTGMGAANPRGRGLTNMAARAETIGARYALTSDESGTRITLDLPVNTGT